MFPSADSNHSADKRAEQKRPSMRFGVNSLPGRGHSRSDLRPDTLAMDLLSEAIRKGRITRLLQCRNLLFQTTQQLIGLLRILHPLSELHSEFRLPYGNLRVQSAARRPLSPVLYTRPVRSSRDLRLAQAPASRPCKHHESRSPGSLCSSSLPNDDSEVPEVLPADRALSFQVLHALASYICTSLPSLKIDLVRNKSVPEAVRAC